MKYEMGEFIPMAKGTCKDCGKECLVALSFGRYQCIPCWRASISPTPPTINACAQWITPSMAQGVVDSALANGIASSRLRWRVGAAQARAMRNFLWTPSSKRDVQRHEAEYAAPETGMFVGVPFYISAEMPPGEIVLEAVEIVTDVGRISCLAVPIGYENTL